jgi:hypothetical protein
MAPAHGLVVDLRCSGCGAGVDPTEEGRCAHCRMEDRGDDQLLSHDSRGWLGEDGERVPCQCGCGMTAVPVQIREVTDPVRKPIPGVPVPVSPWGREEIIAAIQAWSERYGNPPSSASWQKNTEDHPGCARVGAVFGSWSAGLEAAGFDGRRRAPGAWQESQATGKAHAVGSGEDAHAWADALGDVEGVEVKFRHEIPEHSRALLASLGATYVIDARAPVCVTPCGKAECAPEPAARTPKPTSLDTLLEQLAGELER